MSDFAAAMTILASGVGDRLGLFAALAAEESQTASALARRTGYDQIMVHAWLQVMAAAGYIDYEPASETFFLPIEHAVLADREPDTGLAGGFQLFLGMVKPIETIMDAFQKHGGVAQADYDRDLRAGMERMSAPWFETLLVQTWLPAVPGLIEKLKRGIRVADLGCGRGQALVRMANHFPASTFTGYDLFAPVIEEARTSATAAGVAEHIAFVQGSVALPLSGQYDLITMFNSLHDVTPPEAGLIVVREALAPGGCCVILESAFSDKLEENLHPMGAVLYGTGLFYNTPVSIANGGTGPGAAGLTEARIGALCETAGLHVTRLSLPNPMHALYLASR